MASLNYILKNNMAVIMNKLCHKTLLFYHRKQITSNISGDYLLLLKFTLLFAFYMRKSN